MRLKKIKLYGFKSFADEVTLDFSEEVIALVGPNGCGKSNVVDAFRWVLGEQSARSLRADKMHDVIFAGSQTRKPLNFAEVSITLSEIEGPLDEITLTRRLYRSGESEYLINKEQARLKDIQNIFLKEGIGKNAFSIFEQGKLDEIIHLSPLERRFLFDDAAGTTKFLQNKKEASKHLLEVSHNHERIKDLHQEIDRRRKQLKKQAEEALQHQELKKQLENLSQGILSCKTQKLIQLLAGLEEVKISLQKEIGEAKEGYSHSEEALMAIVNELNSKEEQLKIFEEKIYHFSSQLKIKTAEEKREKERGEELDLRLKKCHSSLKYASASHGDEILQLENQREEVEKKKKQLEEQKKRADASFTAFEKSFASLQEQEKKERSNALKILEAKVALEKDLLKAQIEEKKEKEAEEKTQQLIKETEILIRELEEKEKSSSKALALMTQKTEEKKEELVLIEKESKEALSDAEKVKKEHQLILISLRDLKAKVNALQALQDNLEGFSSGGKTLLKEGKKAGLSIKPFFERLTPPKNKEKAFSVAHSLYADLLVVEGIEALKKALKICEDKKIEGYALATEEVALKVENYLEQQKEGCKEADFYHDPFGVIFKAGSGKDTFLREAQLKDLKKELEKAAVNEQEKAAQALSQEEKKETLLKKKQLLQENLRKAEMEQLQANFFLQQTKNDLKKSRSELQGLIATKFSSKKGGLILELQKRIEEESRKEEEAGLLGLKIENALREKQKERDLIFEQKKKEDALFFGLLSDHRSINEKLEVLKAKEKERKEREGRLISEINSLTIAFDQAKEKGQLALGEARSASKALDEFHIAQKDLKESLSELRKRREESEKAHAKERKKIEALEAKEHKNEMSTFEAGASLKPLLEEAKTKYGLEQEELLKISLELSLEEAEKRAFQLRYDLEKGKMINLGAIEEAKVEEERFHQIDKQLLDLNGAKEDIQKVIQKLEQESKRAFKTTFEAIRQNFTKNFSLFFNGGNADLKFTETADILEAGIEILAEPPGKQMKTISLLSGGEKCMTALALLFSIFEVRPAPFCILDEVDAPLDETNVQRFTSVLRKFTPSTQFIIVTHNKKTMAIADVLFGVSMEEKGVSKLISLIFEKKTVTSST